MMTDNDELTDFERRRKLIEGIVSAPDEFIEKIYDDYGKSILSSADNNDTSRLDAAISVGAHSISTDYPSKVEGIDYWVDIPDGNPVACNPISAPIDCTSERIESLEKENN